jgi:hypothetical protein
VDRAREVLERARKACLVSSALCAPVTVEGRVEIAPEVAA